MRSCTAIATVLVWVVGNPAALRADADEVSVHAGLTIGGAAADAQAIGSATFIPAAGVSGTLTYATSDWYAYEATLELEHSIGLASFRAAPDGQAANHPSMSMDTAFVRCLGWLRGEAGISARLGVRWIPTLHAGLGVQVQRAGDTYDVHADMVLPGLGRGVTVGLIGVVGAGLDYRVDEHWVMGMSLRARSSVLGAGGDSYGAIGLALHIGYYWYPANMARSRVGEEEKGPRR
jgi:hypothetical protein